MAIKHFAGLVLISIGLLSCTKSTDKEIKHNFTEKHIPISGSYLSYYPLDCSVYYEDGKEMFAGYNHLDHSIDFISLDGKEQNSSIALTKDGPDKITNVGPFAMVSDSIIINANYFMYVVDKQGRRLQHYNALSRHSQVSFSGLDLDKYRINLPDGIVVQAGKANDLIIAHQNNSLIVPMFKGGKRTQAGFYDNDAFAFVNLSHRNIEPIPVKFPEEYNKDFYGELDRPGYTLVGNKLVYNFPISSAIYTYDLESGEQSSFTVDSRYVPNLTSPTTLADYEDIRKQTKHTAHSSQFFRITYDPYRKQYYRMQKGQTEGEGLQNVRNNRYFTVMDENFKVLAEIPIEDSNYSSNYLIGREGVYFPLLDNGMGQNNLSFAVLKFEEE